MAVLLVGMAGYMFIEIKTGKEGSSNQQDLNETSKGPDKYVVNESNSVELVAANINGQDLGTANKSFEPNGEHI